MTATMAKPAPAAPSKALQPLPAEPPAKPAKPAKRAKAKRREMRAPVLLETVYSVAVAIVILVGLTIAGLSAWGRAPLWLTAVRAGTAVLVVGLVLWIVYYRVLTDGLLIAVDEWMENYKKEQAEREAQEAAEKAAAEAAAQAAEAEAVESTQEWKA